MKFILLYNFVIKISELIDDFKMNQQIQGRKDKYNEYHLAMNYFTKFLMFLLIYERLVVH